MHSNNKTQKDAFMELMTKNLLTVCCSLLFPFLLFAQPDTIIGYDLITHVKDTILPVPYDTSPDFESTSSSVGALGNQLVLDLVPPTSNLFSGSQFSDIARAELFHDVTGYPARAAAALRYTVNGVEKPLCSCIMISPRVVLTAGHCPYNPGFGGTYRSDTMEVVPAYDHGQYPAGIPRARVRKVYLFKKYYDHEAFEDVALLELEDPIGLETGWVGMAYSKDTGFFLGKVFHKFSYPAAPDLYDSTRVYNGDTLYYNYGYVDVIPTSGFSLGIMSSDANGIPGQSGSSFLYTDNTDYYTFAVQSFSSMYVHYTLKQNVFHYLKHVLDDYANGMNEIQAEATIHTNIYPMPFSQNATLEFENSQGKVHHLAIYNSHGSLVQRIENINGNRVSISRNQLPGGIYLYRLTNPEGAVASGKMVVE